MHYTTKRITRRGPRWLKGGLLAKVVFIPLIVVMLLLSGCDDDDDDFEGVDVPELENKTFDFVDARAFRLNNQPATLEIGLFGDGALADDEASFTLTSNGSVAEGTLDLDEGDNPFGKDFSRCDFDIEESTFDIDELRVGDSAETDCTVSQDDRELQLTNRDTGEVSTGELLQELQ